MYASLDVNIVMMMFFELYLLKKISEFPSGTRTHNLMIAGEISSEKCPTAKYNLCSAIWVPITQWLERLTGDQKVVGSSPAWELRNFSQ